MFFPFLSLSEPTKGLKQQIGDAADSYNQLRVSMGDTHTAAWPLCFDRENHNYEQSTPAVKRRAALG